MTYVWWDVKPYATSPQHSSANFICGLDLETWRDGPDGIEA